MKVYKKESETKFVEIGSTGGEYLPLAGGTLTGNLTGKYITGTWLQTTTTSDLGKTPPKVAVLDSQGWIYYRTPAELLEDMGGATKSEIGNYLALTGGTLTGNLTAPSASVTGTLSTKGLKLTNNIYPANSSGTQVAENHTTQVYDKVLHHHGDLIWQNETIGKATLISQEALAYWNGRFNNGGSNLQYFKNGEIASVAQVNAKYTKPSGGIPASDLAGNIPASMIDGLSTATTPVITATASVDSGTGTPSVSVTKSGTNTNPSFKFAFSNLKGAKGDKGDKGERGYSGAGLADYGDDFLDGSGCDIPLQGTLVEVDIVCVSDGALSLDVDGAKRILDEKSIYAADFAHLTFINDDYLSGVWWVRATINGNYVKLSSPTFERECMIIGMSSFQGVVYWRCYY